MLPKCVTHWREGIFHRLLSLPVVSYVGLMQKDRRTFLAWFMNDILILPIPLNKKDILTLDFPGVYFFVKESPQKCNELFLNKQYIDDFLGQCSISYIGKAKKIRQRIVDYDIFLKNKIKVASDKFSKSSLGGRSKPCHENIKKNRLGTVCNTLIIQRFSTHFEACFEEISYIKKFLPIFNKRLKSAPRFCLIESNANLLQVTPFLYGKLEKCTNNFTLILARRTKKFILHFSILISLIKVLEKNSRISRYKFESFGSKKNYTYQSIYPTYISSAYQQPYCLQDEVKKLLEGKKSRLIKHVFLEMQQVAQLQNYYEAALLRDLYFSLRSIKYNIAKTTKLWKNYRKGNFMVQSEFEKKSTIIKFNSIKKENFIENYEKICLVYLWLKNKWENSRWEKESRLNYLEYPK